MDEVVFSWVHQEITGYIYCITFGNHKEGPVKIGYATNIDMRLADLQIGNPYKLYVLAAAPGNIECEKFAHNLLFEHRARAEWFCPTLTVEKFVRRMQAIEKDVRKGHQHQVRDAIKEKSGDCLINIVPGIEEKDLRRILNDEYDT